MLSESCHGDVTLSSTVKNWKVFSETKKLY